MSTASFLCVTLRNVAALSAVPLEKDDSSNWIQK